MIRIGIIGAGPMGAGNARNFAKLAERCRVTAVLDPVADAAAHLAGEMGARAVPDTGAFLQEVDAAIICSPNSYHSEQAIAMANAGKHVFIEKPMALTTADADRIVAAVERAGVASLIGLSVRFDGLVQTMQSMYAAGDLGSLVSIWSRRLGFIAESAGHWRSQFATSGGVMAELLVHELDYMVFIAGLPSSIYCRKMSRLHDDPRANDHIWLTLGFGAEATGTIEGSQMSTLADYYKGLVGTEAALHTRNWQSELYVGRNTSEANLVPLRPSMNKYAHFLDVIEGKCPSVADARHGRNLVHISELALESAVSGQAINSISFS